MHDVIIIGTGPAGLSAAIYTARANLKTAVIGMPEKSRLAKAHAICNYFGIKELPGKELLDIGTKQAQSFGAEIVNDEVVGIEQKEKSFTLKTAGGKKYEARAVILATGMALKLSGIPHEEEFTGKGVHYCPTCDGFFYKNKKIAVIGNSDYAAETALELLPYTKDITIISNNEKFEISDALKKELDKNNIKLMIARVLSLEGEKKLESIVLTRFEKPTVVIQPKYDAAYMATGSASALSFAQKLGLATEGNAVVIDKEGRTNITGIFAAGDCTGGNLQVSKSVGEGCNAAMSAIKFLTGKTMVDYGKRKQ